MDERIQKYEEKMKKTLASLESELVTIRAGRANPHILDKLAVDYYGAPTPLQQVANITVPEAPAPAPAPAPAAAGAGDVPSPLAGKVVSLDVAAGTPVKAGDQILTLEAMKMNTIIYAPASGTLTAFCVNPGDTVQEGQALAKIG